MLTSVLRRAGARRSCAPLKVARPCNRIHTSGLRNSTLLPVIKPEIVDKPDEVTVYIKGFLARGEDAKDFHDWFGCHKKLVETNGWGPLATGFYWASGETPIPYPIATAAHFAVRTIAAARFVKLITPIGLAAAVGGDLALYTGRLIREYHRADTNAVAQSDALACDLSLLHYEYEHVRVVAHSLGCKLLLKALEKIPKAERPEEVHLCAPAVMEDAETLKILPEISTRHTFIYRSERDATLSYLYPLVNGTPNYTKNVIGCHGVSTPLPNVSEIDVDEHFRQVVHTEYRHRFHSFAQSNL